MGLFSSKTPEEKRLQTLCESLGAAAGQVSRGDMPFDFFTDVWDASRAEIATLYDTVAQQKDPKSARKVTKYAITWADVWGGGSGQNRNNRSARAATDLVREALSRTVSGPVA